MPGRRIVSIPCIMEPPQSALRVTIKELTKGLHAMALDKSALLELTKAPREPYSRVHGLERTIPRPTETGTPCQSARTRSPATTASTVAEGATCPEPTRPRAVRPAH